MEMNRSQMYMAGLIVLLVGLHFRFVESVVLNEHATQFLAERIEGTELASNGQTWFAARAPIAKKTITPPRWLGWSLLSIGGVIVLHSLAMRR